MQHYLILGLSAIVLILSIVLVVKGQRSEGYISNPNERQAVCKEQCDLIDGTPFFSGHKQQCMRNCMGEWNADTVLPAGWVGTEGM